MRWWRTSGVIALLILAAIAAYFANDVHTAAFDETQMETTIHQIIRLQEAIYYAVIAGFLFVVAILVAIAKPLYDQGEPKTKEPYPNPFPNKPQPQKSNHQ